MEKGKCYCRIENLGSAYCYVWDCPKHGKEWKKKHGLSLIPKGLVPNK